MDTTCSAMRSQDLLVNDFYWQCREVLNGFAQDKRLNKAEFFRINRRAAAAAVFGWMVGCIGVKTMEPPSCTVTVTRSPTLSRAKSISAASKTIPCELPILEIVFVIP